jgi:hypothetical protein
MSMCLMYCQPCNISSFMQETAAWHGGSHVDELDVVQAPVINGLIHLIVLGYALLEVLEGLQETWAGGGGHAVLRGGGAV